MLLGARNQARQAFEQARAFPEGSEEMTKGIQHAEDVAQILRENVVQGEAGLDDGQYSASMYTCSGLNLTADLRVELRIHEHTERGDNESVKISGTKLKEKPAR